MQDRIRIRINLAAGELELEGPATVIKAHESTIAALLDRLVNTPASRGPGVPAPPGFPPKAAGGLGPLAAPEAFGEFFHGLPKGAKKADQLLAAAFFVQEKSGDGIYTVADASATLVNVGVKLSNPNEFNRLNKESKLVFSMGPGKWKVADAGIERLKKLFSSPIEESQE